MSAGLVSIFNDKDSNHTRTLRAEIDAMPGKSNLKYDPQINEGEVSLSVADYFESVKLIPTFSFMIHLATKASLGLSFEVSSRTGGPTVSFSLITPA